MSENLARHFLLREDVVFLNHGSFGACPRPVFEQYQTWQLELERQPVEFLGRDLTRTMRVPRMALAAELGTAPDDIVGLTNATLGLNIVAQSLDLQPGDQILTTDHEYSARKKTWAYVARRTAEGKSKRDIIRCLKRYVIREVYQLIKVNPRTGEILS